MAKVTSNAQVAGVVILVVFAATLDAQTPPTGTAEGTAEETQETKKTVTQQLLDLLRESEQIDEQHYEDLKKQAEEEAKIFEVAPEGWDFSWNNGFRLNRNDGAFKLKFGGRIQLDVAGIGQSGAVEQAIGGRGFGTEFRRSHLYFSGTAYEYLFFKAQYDFAGETRSSRTCTVESKNSPVLERSASATSKSLSRCSS